ncbi:MAG: MoaD/ThiS family protein [Acidimicrobiia bacterium]|nr:MoaD/ThiS family protein [Acidimicrobiia bacterium]
MTYRVLLFGAEAAAVGERSLDLEIPQDSVTADELKHHLSEAYPGLSGVPTCRVAVNQRFVSGDHRVAPDDEIAVVGPVSGG